MKRSTTRESKPAGEDRRFAAVVEAIAEDPRLAAIAADYAARKQTGGRKFGSNGLKVNGKLFAMVGHQGRLVVKLPKARVDELVARGAAEYFDPGHGRKMKQWASIVSAKLSWLELVLEAHDFVAQL